MKRTLFLAACLLAVAACNKHNPVPQEPDGPATRGYTLRIEPVMTRATDTAFENGDAIGLTVTRASGDYATNQKLTYNGLEFSSSLLWYSEGTDAATLKAYYPYAETTPQRFTVATDQSTGLASSDLIAAVKEGVLPTANAVTMPFKHKLTRLTIAITNNAGYTLDAVTLKGLIPTAQLDGTFEATAATDVEVVDIKAFKVDEKTFTVIVPPQTVAMTAAVTAAGKEMSQRLQEATLAPGKKYSINMIVNPENIQIVLAGEIEDWTDGGELQPDNEPVAIQFEEKLEEGYFTYDNVKYNVVKMKDGKWWMAQNLAYLPEGITPCADINNVKGGVYAPLQLKADGSAPEFTTDAAVIASNGYLYQAEIALGLAVGDLTSVAQAEALEGAQGICPTGWHVPTISDITGLVGKATSPITTVDSAPYYNGSNGSIALLNADGFNLSAYGMVSIQDNTKTSALLQGRLSGYDHLTSSMMCGSSYAGVTYNTSGDETSGVKNLQFWGLMPMTNKASEAEYTCNGTKVSYRIAGPLRCVRNAE